ncbi:MAG: S8 family serine peptidase, partial [Planctomycetota bacterium]
GGLDDDDVRGGDGNDVLTGGAGDDVLQGGAGTDIVKLSGSYADYRLTQTPTGVWIADTKSGRDGTDFVSNAEYVDFADIQHLDLNASMPMAVKDVVNVSGTGPFTITTAQLFANDLDYLGDALQLRSVSDAAGGTVAITQNGDVQFTPSANYTGVMSFKYVVQNSFGHIVATNLANPAESGDLKATVFLRTSDQPSDPLFYNQWYLNAADVAPVWKDYTGQGVTIGQFESGTQFQTGPAVADYRHPDLAPNISQTYLQSGDAITSFSNHATLVAGVMVAARNDEGGVGVAYDAKLASFSIRVEGASQVPDWNVLSKMQDYDIANNSWGVPTPFGANMLLPDQIALQDALFSAAQFGRGGLGTVMVFGAGNERESGGNANYSTLSNSDLTIAVGAINAPGDPGSLVTSQTPFSDPGASILISAPGSNVISTSQLLMNDNGSTFGNDYETASGTSFATPLVSGVVALMLQANPNLGYRDVQAILALSAKKVVDANTTWTDNHAVNWNGGGMHFSDDYGFGNVDARAAVRLAETWERTSTVENMVSVLLDGNLANTAIPDGGTVSDAIAAPTGLWVEHADVVLEWDHQRWGDLVVTLTSPSGTQSVLMNRPGKAPGSPASDLGDLASGWNRFIFSTTHDWGEDSGGNWQISVTDAAGGATGVVSWKLQLSGSVLAGGQDWDNTYVYTDEYGTLGVGSRAILTDTDLGLDELNVAAVTGNSTINLNSGATSTIAGRSLTIGSSTVIENAIGGDGNDALTGNAADNRLAGGRGNDVITADGGRDILEGGRGNDTLTGGTDTDLFVINKDAGSTDTITDFDATKERIALVGFGSAASFADLTLTQEGANTRVSLDGGQSVVLNNTTASTINAAHFKFFDQFNFAGQYIGTDQTDPEFEFTTLSSLPKLYIAGSGDDRIFGGMGSDMLLGDDGNDLLVGEHSNVDVDGGSDAIFGGAGDDRVEGGPGDDVLIGGDGRDIVRGNAGSDTIYLEGDADDPTGASYGVYGDSGSDRFVVRPDTWATPGPTDLKNFIGDFDPADPSEKIDLSQIAQVTQFSDLSFETITVPGYTSLLRVDVGGPGSNLYVTLYSSTSITQANLSASNFIFYQPPPPGPTSGADTLTGDAGGNTLDGGAGADTMTGRTGDDTYLVDNIGDIVNELPGGGFDTVKVSISYALGADLENLVLTGTGNFNGTGNAATNRITGNSGNNILDGGTGADTLIGDGGDDTYLVDNGSDSVIEQAGGGIDTVQSSVSYTLSPEIENLALTGPSTGSGQAGAINATGNAANNTLTGNSNDNTLDGAGGADTVIGGAGDDIYLVDNNGDVVTELPNEGVDAVYAGITY